MDDEKTIKEKQLKRFYDEEKKKKIVRERKKREKN